MSARLHALLLILGFSAACTQVASEPRNAELHVEGMTCESCVQAIEHEVGKLAGVESCSVDLENERARVRFDPEQIQIAKIEAVIDKLGYEASVSPTAP